MKLALQILLALYCVQSLVKFGVHFLVPYGRRIRQMERNYAKDRRVIGIYDDITLLIQVVMVVLLFVTGVQYLSFLTGLFVGMALIQLYFHRFIRPLAEDKTPESPFPPVKLMSFAIQAQPALAWREYLLMTAAAVWGLYALIAHGFVGT